MKSDKIGYRECFIIPALILMFSSMFSSGLYNLPFHGIYFLNGPLLTFSEKRNDMSFEKSCSDVNENNFFMCCPKVMPAWMGKDNFFYVTLPHCLWQKQSVSLKQSHVTYLIIIGHVNLVMIDMLVNLDVFVRSLKYFF